MTLSKRAWLWAIVVVCGFSALTVRLSAQPTGKSLEAPTANLVLARPGTKFQFDVIEMFDAKYQGDTPGYLGRSGGLAGIRPHIALGDPVYRGEEKVGSVTNVVWSRTQDGMTIEFDPNPLTRVTVGDPVWLYLNPPEGPVK
jgi:hypothetical protein